VPGIRTNAAAEYLGVSPSALRGWEKRFGFPAPDRTEGGHRHYDLAELEALRHALLDTPDVSAAIEIARRRGSGPATPARLLDAFERFERRAADRAMEESVAIRSVERSVEELLLPGVELAETRAAAARREAEHAFACVWAIEWLAAAGRAGAEGRAGTVVLMDWSAALGAEVVQVVALELMLRRQGFVVVHLPMTLAGERVVHALTKTKAVAAVLCGTGATLDEVARLVYSLRHGMAAAPLFDYRGAVPTSRTQPIPSLGFDPVSAAAMLQSLVRRRRDDARA